MTRTINTPNGPIIARVESGVLTLDGPTGTHRVMIDERTNVNAHIAGFVEANGGAANAVSTGIHYGDIGPMNTENPYDDGRQGETLQPVTLNGEHVGNLARCYNADTGEDLRLVFYDWRPLNPAHDFDDDDDCVCDYRSARAALAAKKAQIAAALGA